MQNNNTILYKQNTKNSYEIFANEKDIIIIKQIKKMTNQLKSNVMISMNYK